MMQEVHQAGAPADGSDGSWGPAQSANASVITSSRVTPNDGLYENDPWRNQAQQLPIPADATRRICAHEQGYKPAWHSTECWDHKQLAGQTPKHEVASTVLSYLAGHIALCISTRCCIADCADATACYHGPVQQHEAHNRGSPEGRQPAETAAVDAQADAGGHGEHEAAWKRPSKRQLDSTMGVRT
eukprot:66279-Pyramimonas_sp.AAC.1